MKTLILFDFDGTLTKKDSLSEFFKFCYGPNFNRHYYLKPFIWIILLKFRLINYQRIKSIRIKQLTKRYTRSTLEKKSLEFRKSTLPLLIKKSALEKIKKYKESPNTEMVLVSASLNILLCDWAKEMGMKLITNELEIKNNQYTGAFVHENDCNFIEKVNRINEIINLEDYQHIVAYGDTDGDRDMLNIADESHFDFFKD
tara:strand:+ start:1926 stop:2525 length:600 start_codon:yes stop_codon:yes gene_type:complete